MLDFICAGRTGEASEAGRNGSFVRPKTPQRRDTELPPAENATARGRATESETGKGYDEPRS